MASFHYFPLLPYELRTQIWEMTVEPRVVEVRIPYDHSQYCGTGSRILTSKTPVPAVLQVCREARNAGLYQKAFHDIGISDRGPQYVWFNFEADIIDIGTTYFDEYRSVAPLIRRLRFERENSNEYFYHWETEDLRLFINAEEIYIVCADGLEAWLGALEEHWFPCGEENVFFIDPEDEQRMFRGNEGLDKVADIIYGEVESGETDL